MFLIAETNSTCTTELMYISYSNIVFFYDNNGDGDVII